MSETEFIKLKWGTIKSWRLNENGPAFQKLKEFFEFGVPPSAALDRPNKDKRKLLAEIIDLVDGPVFDDWNGGEFPSKEEAKKYVLYYGD